MSVRLAGTHVLLHQVSEGGTGSSFGDEGQHDESAVVVGEAFVRTEGLGASVEHGQVIDGVGQGVHRNRQHIVMDLVTRALVDMVADS